MSHPNAALLQGMYEAFSQGDPGPLLGALTDDISWHDSTSGPLAGHYCGKDQVSGLLAKMTEVYGGPCGWKSSTSSPTTTAAWC